MKSYIIKQTSEAAYTPPSREIDLNGNYVPEGNYLVTTTVTLTPLEPIPVDAGSDIPE